MIIILSGFKASGKTTIAKQFAVNNKYKFIDVDDYILELFNNNDISEIGQLYKYIGEKEFREKEHRAVSILCQEFDQKDKAKENCIIALGGGTLLNPNNYKMLNNLGVIVYLKENLELISNRIKSLPELPELFKSKVTKSNNIDQVLKEYYIARAYIYKNCCDFILDTTGKSIDVIVDEIDMLVSPNLKDNHLLAGNTEDKNIKDSEC